MKKLYKNWPIHNLIAHPLSEIVHWFTSPFWGHRVSGWIHDVTVPCHEKEQDYELDNKEVIDYIIQP